MATVSEVLVREPAAELVREDVENPCALCGRFEGVTMFAVGAMWVARCPACKLVRSATRPGSPLALYDQAYFRTDRRKGGYANYELDAGINKLTFRRRLRAIEELLGRRGTLLDVGCALGDFIEAAGNDDWTAEGVEVSPHAIAVARSRGLSVHAGPLEEAGLPSRAFDVVTLYDTIEHLTDPVAALREVRRLLRPGGLLHVVTPNVAGLQARLLGRYWYHYKPDEHLYYFSPDTLRETFQRAGIEWHGWSRSGSYVTPTYVFNRLRAYVDKPFAALEWIGRALALGPFAFHLYVGEMQAWGRRGP